MFVMDCLCFLPVRVGGMMARKLMRVTFDNFEAVLLSWRGRKLLSRQLSRLMGLLLCLGVLGSVATRPSRKGCGFRFKLTLNVKTHYLRVKTEFFRWISKLKRRLFEMSC